MSFQTRLLNTGSSRCWNTKLLEWFPKDYKNISEYTSKNMKILHFMQNLGRYHECFYIQNCKKIQHSACQFEKLRVFEYSGTSVTFNKISQIVTRLPKIVFFSSTIWGTFRSSFVTWNCNWPSKSPLDRAVATDFRKVYCFCVCLLSHFSNTRNIQPD